MEISFARLFWQGDFSDLATELPQWHIWQNGRCPLDFQQSGPDKQETSAWQNSQIKKINLTKRRWIVVHTCDSNGFKKSRFPETFPIWTLPGWQGPASLTSQFLCKLELCWHAPKSHGLGDRSYAPSCSLSKAPEQKRSRNRKRMNWPLLNKLKLYATSGDPQRQGYKCIEFMNGKQNLPFFVFLWHLSYQHTTTCWQCAHRGQPYEPLPWPSLLQVKLGLIH